MYSIFHVSAWVGSIAFGVTFFGGPIASNLCERFGCRLIAAIGGLIGVLGFLMTSFANSVYVIYFTYSVVWGFGSSLSYATTTFVIGEINIFHIFHSTVNSISVLNSYNSFYPHQSSKLLLANVVWFS